MKIKAKYFREIEYVEVKDLPQEQQTLLTQFKDADYIKILIEDKIIGPCLQYSQYETWYNALRMPHLSENAMPQSQPLSQVLVGKL